MDAFEQSAAGLQPEHVEQQHECGVWLQRERRPDQRWAEVSYNAEGRLSAVTTGATDTSPTTRYAHNALGQRVFKTEPLYRPTAGDESNPRFMQSLVAFFTKLWAPSTTDASIEIFFIAVYRQTINYFA